MEVENYYDSDEELDKEIFEKGDKFDTKYHFFLLHFHCSFAIRGSSGSWKSVVVQKHLNDMIEVQEVNSSRLKWIRFDDDDTAPFSKGVKKYENHYSYI